MGAVRAVRAAIASAMSEAMRESFISLVSEIAWKSARWLD